MLNVLWEKRKYTARVTENVYGEVNSVKKHNYKIWLNDGVY